MALFGGKPLSRLDELKKIVTKDPRSRQFLALAEEYRKLGRLREAMETLERGIQATPGYVAAYVALGRTCQQMGLPDQAIVAFGSALKYDRENLVAIRQIADTYLKKGEKVEAIKKLKLFRALKAGDPEVEQLIQQLDAELNPPRPRSTDAWPTSGSIRAPASPFGSRSPTAPVLSSSSEVPAARFEPLRTPLETSGAFSRRDFPRPPDFAAAPYPKERLTTFSAEGSPLAGPGSLPGVDEPFPMPSGVPDRMGSLSRVEPPTRPAPPPTPPPRALLADPPMARSSAPFDGFEAVAEPRPFLPRREPTTGSAAPLPSPAGPPPFAATGSVSPPERTGPIGRTRVPDAAELLELTFDGGGRRAKVERPASPSAASTAEVVPPPREQATAPVEAPSAEPPSAGSSRPITMPIPDAGAPSLASVPSRTVPPVASSALASESDSVFDFDEEPLPPSGSESGVAADVLGASREVSAAASVPIAPDAVAFGELAPLLEPEPAFERAPEPSPFESESEPAPLVTETLAELYRAQGHVVEARDAYGSLAATEPDEARAQELEARAAALSERLERSRVLRQWAGRLPSPPRAEIESLGEVLEALVSGTEGVRAASLTDLEGLPVVSAGDPALETLVAELSAFWKGVQRVRDDIGAGSLRGLTFTAGEGAAFVAAASPEYSLILQTDRDAPLGRIRYEVGRVSALLRPVLG